MNKSPNIERNSAITIHILSGKTYREVGNMFNITGSRAYQCVSRLLRTEYPSIYDKVKLENSYLIDTRKLREKYSIEVK